MVKTPTVPSDTSILFITVDALSPTQMGTGRQPSPSPFLDSLCEDGFTVNSCFATGGVTQIAVPSLMSSTLPLDYGGYEYGVEDRPTVLAEQLASHGYETGAVLTGFYTNKLYGFDRGIDTFCPLVYANVWKHILERPYLVHSKTQLDSDAYSDADIINTLTPFIQTYFEQFKQYCQDRQAEINGTAVHPRTHSSSVTGLDFESVVNAIDKQLASLNCDPTEHVESMLDEFPDNRILSELDAAWEPPTVAETIRSQTSELRRGILWTVFARLIDVRTGFGRLRGGIAELVGSLADGPPPVYQTMRSTRRELQRIPDWMTGQLVKPRPSAGHVLDNFAAWVEDTAGPFFGWTHLMDVHNQNPLTWEQTDGAKEEYELSVLQQHLGQIRDAGSCYTGSIDYDLGIRYTDYMLERFFDRIDDLFTEPPLVVLTADHGINHPVPNLPRRTGHQVETFWDERIQIPLTFVHPSIRSESYDGLVSAIDIAPTLLDILGFDIPDGFDGTSIFELPSEGREFVVAESMGKGLCNITDKQPQICLRSSQRKISCSASVAEDGDFSLTSAYDLESDPYEQRPIEKAVPPSFGPLVDSARTRAEEIRRSMG